MSRRWASTIERRLELIELAVETARAEYAAGRRTRGSLIALEKRARQDRTAILAMLRGIHGRRSH